jgi:hypothetical protein
MPGLGACARDILHSADQRARDTLHLNPISEAPFSSCGEIFGWNQAHGTLALVKEN